MSLQHTSGASPLLPPAEFIRLELGKAGVRGSAGRIQLEQITGNPKRMDYQERQHFRLLLEGKPRFVLTLGSGIKLLYERAKALSSACPGIVCKPLHFFEYENTECVVFEYFDGRDLESLWRERRIEISQIRHYAQGIVEALETTSEPSTSQAAKKELEALFTHVSALPLFNGFDRSFLLDSIFPMVLAGALAEPQRTRWTNGDLIPRNILVNAEGDVRLLDYEFAERTHFFFDDAWRWRVFSSLPESASDLPTRDPHPEPSAPWQETYSLLRQLVLACKINGPASAIPDTRPALDQLLNIAAKAKPGTLRTSVFLEREFAANNASVEKLRQRNARLEDLLRHRETELATFRKDLGWQVAQEARAFWRRLFGIRLHVEHYFIDVPVVWRCATPQLTIRGWCLPQSGQQITALRAQIKGRTYPGVFGIERPDVSPVYPNHPQSTHCGFAIEVELKPGDKKIELAACDTNGIWHIFCHRQLQDGAAETVRGTYAHWIKEFDVFTPEKLELLTRQVLALPQQPRFSIILPVHNTPEKFLSKAIDSVRAQIYPHWELCIADDASSAPHVRPILEHYQRIDNRIRVAFRTENGHIAAASNTALALATGDFIALLDHDDELQPHALAEAVIAINRQPDLKLIYSDEDKIDEEGNRFDPFFKPDWMPDLLIGHNYLCHFSVCRTDTLRSIGGWRPGFDGAQDWDLQLRIVEQTSPAQIVHIPKILYHWRAVAGSTALATSEKNYVIEAARKAITEHFQRTSQKVELIHQPGNHWRARYALPSPTPLVSLIIPTRNGLTYLRRCVESIIEKSSYSNLEIIIADNDSDDTETCAYLQAIARPDGARTTDGRPITVSVLPCPGPFNYSAINNAAVREARGEFVALLNNDLEIITADWLEELVSHAARPGIGCVGPMLYYPNDTLQHAGVVLGIAGHAGHAFKGLKRGTPGYMNHARLVKNYSAVTGACLVVRKSTYQQVGGLDETGLAVAFSDVDFCLKVLAAGYRNLWTPFAELYHHESATRGYEDSPEKMARFARERDVLRQRWLPQLEHDPAYNPNLTLATEDFALAYPPRL
jgi:glycosyltransferase involved in cell wall biosynthesis